MGIDFLERSQQTFIVSIFLF